MKKPLALSTICISAALSLPVAAQQVPEGCFARSYDTAHLAANPAQGVQWITVEFTRDPSIMGGTFASIVVGTADQGQAARDGAGGWTLRQTVSNFTTPLRFSVDGDGGGFDVVRNGGDSLDLRSAGMFLSPTGDFHHDPSTSLAEDTGRPTTYRLFAANPSTCR